MIFSVRCSVRLITMAAVTHSLSYTAETCRFSLPLLKEWRDTWAVKNLTANTNIQNKNFLFSHIFYWRTWLQHKKHHLSNVLLQDLKILLSTNHVLSMDTVISNGLFFLVNNAQIAMFTSTFVSVKLCIQSRKITSTTTVIKAKGYLCMYKNKAF